MIVTLAVLAAFFFVDIFIIGRKPHIPSTKECVHHILFFIAAALVFGGIMWAIAGSGPAIEFYSGWLTEYSLSIDNLFVFVIIMSNFSVPRKEQKYVLSIGIAIALVLRGIFIMLGSAIVERFTWIFFFFGAFLIVTAVKLLGGENGDEEYHEPAFIKILRKAMLIVFSAIGTTDVMFAFDSIPAIFGLTKDPFIVFVSNVFALLGLQQLYFLLGSLLDKLVYLPLGLSVVLGFIGVKLIMEALHGNSLSFINSGQPFENVPEIPTWVSLAVIVLSLSIASVASIAGMRSEEAKQIK